MTAPLAPLARLLLWDYNRGTLPYDLLVAVLLLVLLAVPPGWWGDPLVGAR
jgi:hypothetical protein